MKIARRFRAFTTGEVNMLYEQAKRSNFDIMMNDRCSALEKATHAKLVAELTKELKFKKQEGEECLR
jgi:hypothetical protein